MSAKFDEEVHNGSLFIVFTKSKYDGHTHWRKEPQQRYYIPTARHWAGIISMWGLRQKLWIIIEYIVYLLPVICSSKSVQQLQRKSRKYLSKSSIQKRKLCRGLCIPFKFHRNQFSGCKEVKCLRKSDARVVIFVDRLVKKIKFVRTLLSEKIGLNPFSR